VDGYSCEGVLRFYGSHHAKGVERCGVELDEPVGKNNGIVDGHEYFRCGESKGLLMVPAKVLSTNKWACLQA
jgi:dynactin complex subunit